MIPLYAKNPVPNSWFLFPFQCHPYPIWPPILPLTLTVLCKEPAL
jgi:hypothetical protein